MQKVINIFISILRSIFIICFVVGIFGVVIVGWANSPAQYIYKKTEFLSCFFPKEIYSFDAIGHGMDYDSIHIFKLAVPDEKRFLFFLKDNSNWNLLPIDGGVINHVLCDEEFDGNMRDMLAKEDGYWMISPEHNLFCVYDKAKQLLYIRTASSFSGYKWTE